MKLITNMFIFVGLSLGIVFAQDWTEPNPADYQFNGSVTARVQLDGAEVGSTDDMVAAFVGDEIRGLSEGAAVPPFLGGGVAFAIMIYSNTDGETVSFKYFDAASGEIIDLNETIEFASDMTIGVVNNAFILTGTAGTPDVAGCTNSDACNYDDSANSDDGSCEYPSGCDNACGSTLADDACGVCGGDGSDDAGCGCFEAGPSGCDNACGSDLATDSCGVCGGDGTSCVINVDFSLGDAANGGVDVFMSNTHPVTGFQFSVSGMNLSAASGGSADAAGFDVGTGPNGVVGFSMTGSSIPAGDGLLTSLSGSFDDFSACLGDLVLSVDGEGFHTYTTGVCVDTDAVADCAGDANGSATEDACGVCNGDGSDDAGCGCFEAGPSGCDNTCGSDLADDACGVCGGDGSDDAGCGCFEAGPSGCDNACGSTLADDDCGVCGGDNSSCLDCAGVPNGSSSLDDCDVCDGDGSSCRFDVMYDSNAPIYGFQFSVSGASLTGDAEGGAAAEAGFSVSASSNTGNVIGFDFSGASIATGSGILTTLKFDGDASSACLSNLVLSGDAGSTLSGTVSDCLTVYYESGCADADACNYNESATEDDGSCYNNDEGCGCDQAGPSGCDNACGSDLADDECGVCGGDSSSCDEGCGPNEPGPSGCDSTCGSDLADDACGVCGGDGSDDAGCGCFEAGPSGCDNACGSTLADDDCGVCGGDGSDDVGCGCFEAGPSGCDNVCGSNLADDECGVCGGDNSSCLDCAGVPNGSSSLDDCDVCDGAGSSCRFDVMYDSNAPIYGFQFSVSNTDLSGAEGGAAEANGLMVSVGTNGVIGFSMSGASIPAGAGVLTTLKFDGDASDGCLGDLILSGPAGSTLSGSVSDCLTVYYESGCADADACNYNESATEDDGSCYNNDEGCGCDQAGPSGCDNACGSDLADDECGVCGGDSSSCDEGCGPNEPGPSGCDNACGSDLATDSCGVCGGDGTSCVINVDFSLGDAANGGVDVFMSNTHPVTGFQFSVSGMNLSGASGGSADAAGFDVGTGPNGVVGFSMTGSSIPAGDGLLTSLSGSFDDFSACLGDLVLSVDGEGFHTYTTGVCVDTDAVADCAGDANGSATEDACGVCNGDGSDDAGCGCFEAGPSGCDNACGSTLADDDCGVCGGDGSDDAGCGCFEAGPSGCDNTCGSDLADDACGVCGGDGSDDAGCGCFEAGPSGCDNTCGSDLADDACGVCGGDGSDDAGCGCFEAGPSGCDNACGSTLADDACGVCGGDGSDDAGCGCFEAGPSGCDNACGSDLATDSCGVCGGDGT